MLLVVFGALVALTARAGATPLDGAADAADARDAADGVADAADAADAGVDPDALEPEHATPRRELSAFLGGGLANDGERLDVGLRRERASRWGRLDLELLWRRSLDGAADTSRRDELWLLAIWSR